MTFNFPASTNPQISAIATEFMSLCGDVFFSYLDAVAGVDCIRIDLIHHQKITAERFDQSLPPNEHETYMDKQSLTHLLDADEKNPEKLLHQSTQGEFKLRTALEGRDVQLLGGMAIAFLFATWEDRYRERFALALGYSKKNDLKSDLFGDLCKLRNAVIHNRGIATEEVERAKILRWFKRGEIIFVPRERVDDIYSRIHFYINQLCIIPPHTSKPI